MEMTQNVYWTLELKINGSVDELRSLMEEMSEATKNDEPGALNYEWWISEDESTCHIFERYADSAATMTHVHNFGRFAERFMALVEPARNPHIYGDADDAVKEALAAFGAIFMSPLGGFQR